MQYLQLYQLEVNAGPSPKVLQRVDALLELTVPPGCQMEAIGMEKHLGIV